MRNFEILRYIKKWKYLIVIVCILGAVLVYQYAMSKQTYTAQTVLRYSNSEASNGLTPSGDSLDVSEIYSSKVITGVLEDLDLNTGADSIRSKCAVEPIIPADEESRKEAILKDGEEYVYHPTDYLVTFSVGSDYSKGYAASVLDSILKNYFINYGEKYINQTVLPNNASNIESGSYDYIESAEILDTSATDIYNYLYDKKFHYPAFRSAATGYSFNDLYNMYKEELNYNIPELYSKILNQKVSKDQSVLIKDYRNRISQYQIDLANLSEKIDPLYALITQYSQKSKEGIQYHYGKGTDSDNTSDYILKDVYEDEYKHQINIETTYDALINQYVSLEIDRQYTQVDKEHREELLNIFETAEPASNADEAIKEIQNNMKELIDSLDKNYEIVEKTVDEFNQYLGASNITSLTSINVNERINIKLYLMIAVVLFLICGCLGAILLGRMQDFIEYLMYMDRKTKLPNRAKCDMLINQYEEKPLPDNFTFILIRLDVLKAVNSQIGRTAGDTLLGEFGQILRETAEDYGFVGYNGSDQFMCMFENCSYKKAEMFIDVLTSYVEHYNSQNPKQDIAFSYAIEETRNKGIYDARGLISASFRDINANTNIKSERAENYEDRDDGGDDDGPGGGVNPKNKSPKNGPNDNSTCAGDTTISKNSQKHSKNKNHSGSKKSVVKHTKTVSQDVKSDIYTGSEQNSRGVYNEEIVKLVTDAVMAGIRAERASEKKETIPGRPSVIKYNSKNISDSYPSIEWTDSKNDKSNVKYKAVTETVSNVNKDNVSNSKESVMSKPDNIKSVDEPKKDIQAKLNTKVEHDIVSDTSENIEEVKVLVRESTNNIKDSSVISKIDDNNPYAPKPRVKKSYRSKKSEEPKSLNLDMYAPKKKK